MDLASGLDPAVDEITADVPSDPAYREGVSMWLWDDAAKVTLPRIAIDAVGAAWESARQLWGNIAMPDGRVWRIFSQAPALPTLDAAGRPRVLGAGPMRFECLEPFTRWRCVFQGDALATSVEDQIARRAPDASATVPVTIDLDARMAAPAWMQGSLGGQGFIPGERRFEQLFKAEGQVRIGGEAIDFSGGGLRIHRKGGNRTAPNDFFGHNWHSAVFPSGRAFGFIHYYPRPDGSQKFVEGWVMGEDGEVLPAQVLDTPWMRDMQPRGEALSFTLRTQRGDARIEGVTIASTFFPARQFAQGGQGSQGNGGSIYCHLQEGTTRYRWDGEEALGMIERSYMPKAS